MLAGRRTRLIGAGATGAKHLDTLPTIWFLPSTTTQRHRSRLPCLVLPSTLIQSSLSRAIATPLVGPGTLPPAISVSLLLIPPIRSRTLDNHTSLWPESLIRYPGRGSRVRAIWRLDSPQLQRSPTP